MADPRRVAAVTRRLDMQAVQEAVRNIDRTKVRDAMLARWKQRLKQQLEATDEEWKALEPLILKVVRARRDARLDPRTPGGARVGGVASAVPGDGPSAVDEAEAALRELARDPEAARHDVARSLADYRRAREGARKRLDAAENELKAVLSQRQESVLILLGILR
jgi:sugar-specific transcriptional regulator TrmB